MALIFRQMEALKCIDSVLLCIFHCPNSNAENVGFWFTVKKVYHDFLDRLLELWIRVCVPKIGIVTISLPYPLMSVFQINFLGFETKKKKRGKLFGLLSFFCVNEMPQMFFCPTLTGTEKKKMKKLFYIFAPLSRVKYEKKLNFNWKIFLGGFGYEIFHILSRIEKKTFSVLQ